MKIYLTLILLMVISMPPAYAGEADVLKVVVTGSGDGSYQFQVTVSHRDEGWKHYADKWDIVALDGTVLATRVLYHPHVNEQPFTRSLSGVKIAGDLHKVKVRAHDSVHAYGGKTVTVELPR